MKKFHARGKNLGSTGGDIGSRVIIAACSVIREQIRMTGFSAFSTVLDRTTANVDPGGVYVIFVIRVWLHQVTGACNSCCTLFLIFLFQKTFKSNFY